MSDFEKLWLQPNLNAVAMKAARQAINELGMALPCSVVSVTGSIVTVKFEVNSTPFTLPNVTIPKAESPWIRMPTQVGDMGLTMPADVYLGGVSGLGDGVASMARPGNLSALVFVPISNKNSTPTDPNAAQISGPNGVILETTTGTTSTAVINQSGQTYTYGSSSIQMDGSSITLTAGGKTVVINSTGVTIDGKVFETHMHSGVQTGGGISGPPV